MNQVISRGPVAAVVVCAAGQALGGPAPVYVVPGPAYGYGGGYGYGYHRHW